MNVHGAKTGQLASSTPGAREGRSPARSRVPLDFLARLATFAFIILTGQAAYFHLSGQYSKDLIPRAEGFAAVGGYQTISMARLDSIAAQMGDVLFLGDSSTLYLQGDRSGITEDTAGLLDHALTGCRVTPLLQGGFELDMLSRMAEYFAARGARPRVVVVTLNLRAFGPRWYLAPDRQFKSLRMALWLSPRRLAFLLPALRALNLQEQFGKMDRAANPAWSRAAVDRPGLRGLYGFDIRPDNPQFESIARVQRAADEMGATLVLYLTPVDLGSISIEAGPVTEAAASANLDIIRESCRLRGIELLDLSASIEKAHMLEIGESADHMDGYGRTAVAEAIAREIQSRRSSDCGEPLRETAQ